MTHDPWTLHASLACPSCHVVGKVVRDESNDCGCCLDCDGAEPYVCCECGQTWADTGVAGDVKPYRIQYARLIEGRPYEPPEQDAAWLREQQAKTSETMEALEGLLREYYGRHAETLGPTQFDGQSKGQPTGIQAWIPDAKSGSWREVPVAFTAAEAGFNFHAPVKVPRPPELGTEPEDAAWLREHGIVIVGEMDGVYRVAAVDRETGVVTLEPEDE